MPADDDLPALLSHIRLTLRPSDEWLEPEGYPDSLGLCVLDSIWSIGVRYGGVQKVVTQYRALRRGSGGDPSLDSAADLRKAIARAGGPERFADALNNRQLTSTRSGILKADAVDQACSALMDVGVITADELRSAEPAVREGAKKAWRGVRGQRSGISWRYLLLLAGDQEVKPDRMIVRFVAAGIRRTPRTGEAADLLTAAATNLNVPVRALDQAAWRQQSGRR